MGAFGVTARPLVSIHAAQAGCDWACRLWCTRKAGFNSRSPSGLRRRQHLQRHRGDPRFNSRSPSGLRQSVLAHLEALGAFQFTQPKRAATLFVLRITRHITVSIHAVQAGCDSLTTFSTISSTWFQFTQPKRAATVARVPFFLLWRFQFTQPKWAATSRYFLTRLIYFCFNSRSPNGLRPNLDQ